MHTIATENQGGSLHNQYKHSDKSAEKSYRYQTKHDNYTSRYELLSYMEHSAKEMETQDQMSTGRPVDECAVMQPRLLLLKKSV